MSIYSLDFQAAVRGIISSMSEEELRFLNGEVSREVGLRSKNGWTNRLKLWCRENEATAVFNAEIKDGVVNCRVSVTHPLFGIAFGTFTGTEKFGNPTVISKKDCKYVMEGASSEVIKVISLYCAI